MDPAPLIVPSASPRAVARDLARWLQRLGGERAFLQVLPHEPLAEDLTSRNDLLNGHGWTARLELDHVARIELRHAEFLQTET